MAVREDILQGIRTWLKTSESLTDAQVIPADDDGPRPALPYLTVKVLTADAEIGRDEDVRSTDGSGDPTLVVRGERRATVSVQAFGTTAEGWLSTALLKRRLPSIQEVLLGVGLTIEPMGPIRDLSRLVDTAIEPRFGVDLEVTYLLTSDTVAETEALSVVGTYTFDGEPSDLTVSSTVSLSS